MPKIKTKKLISKTWRRRLGLKSSYDLDDLDDLLEDLLKGLWRWLWHRRKDRREKQVEGKNGRFPTSTSAKSKTPAKAESASPMATPAIQGQYEQALAYQAEIRQLAQRAEGELARDRLNAIAERVDWWVGAIEDLAGRVDQFQQNELIRRDQKRVPKAIADLEKRLAEESNPMIRQELARTLASRRQQQETLEKLDGTMRWAEIKIENTVSMLGTIYSQLLMGQSKGQVADYRHLLHEVNEEVDALQDYLDALQEVKLGHSSATPW